MSSQAMTALQSQKMEARTVVICGGSTGIGAGVARLYAKLGAPRIIVTGRDEAKGNALIDVMRSLAPASSAMDVSFVKTDLMCV
jgi:NAD(P)-dependent dehydrogenase (short-subunit alcohol dehydrogenase family)